MNYYPLLLDLRRRRCVVIGGGEIAARKVELLLDCEAEVCVIAPIATTRLQEWSALGRVRLEPRPYRAGDLKGARLVIAATDDRNVNAAVYQEAETLGIPCNSVDDLPSCNFIVPAVVRRGEFLLAIGTGGAAPALAARLKARLEHEFGEEWGDLVAHFRDLREDLARRIPDPAERKRAWYTLVDAALAGELGEHAKAAIRRVQDALGEYRDPGASG